MPSESSELAGHYLPNDWSVLTVSGEEAATFLQGFCTNDVLALSAGGSCEAFFTDMKARVLAYTWVVRLKDRCLVILTSPGAEALARHLDKYVLNAQVELRVDSDSRVAILFSRSQAVAPEGVVRVALSAFGEKTEFAIGGADVLSGWLASPGDASESISEEEFELRRILRGVPKDGADVDQRNLPQEVDRVATSISFTKGCYLGQEPVARIDAMGHVNWLLRGLRFAGAEARRGDELRSGDKVVGRVTSVAQSGGQTVGLGYVRRESAAEGASLEHATGAVSVHVAPMRL